MTFANVGHQPGLVIWRVEKFTLAELSPALYGTFYEGDTYVLLFTEQLGPNTFSWNIHFWIGTQSSQDEYGTAAFKVVELDDRLGGKAVQHRECQGVESQKFCSYFPEGIRVLKGGNSSSFNKVDVQAEFKNRLFKAKGKIGIEVVEVVLATASLNSGDVFILDTLNKIFVWQGAQSTVFERNRAGQFATAVRNQRGAKPAVVILSEGQDDDAEFWATLGGKGPIASAVQGGSDIDININDPKRLIRLTEVGGQLKLEPVAEGKLSRTMLSSHDAFIVDAGFEVFVYIGAAASPLERKGALGYAQKYLALSNRPPTLPITKIHEGAQIPTFEAVFA